MSRSTSLFTIVLHRPQIPQNTGNIVRTCSVMGADIVLVDPQFSLSDRHLKRAGLDYWEGVSCNREDTLEDWLGKWSGPVYFFSSKASHLYTEADYTAGGALIFGSETEGLPEFVWKQYATDFYTIPMRPLARCLNLATSVGIVAYEAWRQWGFLGNRMQESSS